MSASRSRFADGRWHFQHGPIDLILEAWGADEECTQAYDQAWARFATVLPELVAELPKLRSPLSLRERGCPTRSVGGVRGSKRDDDRVTEAVRDVIADETVGQLRIASTRVERQREDREFDSHTTFAAPHPLPPLPQGEGGLQGVVAKRMWNACAPFAQAFITPMAAVAGAVADEIIAAMTARRALRKAYVNNGGDIAIYLATGERFETGIVGDLAKPKITATASIAAADPVRGIATSGWRGRSFSLGVADAVTVLARDAAAADAAATLIANAVDIEHPAILRRPARELDPDSDLGEHLVTVEVGALDSRSIDEALAHGQRVAQGYWEAGRIEAAYLELAGRRVAVGGGTRRHEVRQSEMAWSLRA